MPLPQGLQRDIAELKQEWSEFSKTHSYPAVVQEEFAHLNRDLQKAETDATLLDSARERGRSLFGKLDVTRYMNSPTKDAPPCEERTRPDPEGPENELLTLKPGTLDVDALAADDEDPEPWEDTDVGKN